MFFFKERLTSEISQLGRQVLIQIITLINCKTATVKSAVKGEHLVAGAFIAGSFTTSGR